MPAKKKNVQEINATTPILAGVIPAAIVLLTTQNLIVTIGTMVVGMIVGTSLSVKSAFKKKDIDWQNSRAHHELLSMFLDQYRIKSLMSNENWVAKWENVLGEDLEDAIKRFIKNNYLIPAPLPNILDDTFNLTDLKKFAKELGIPVSGKKVDLISRIISHDENYISKKVSAITDVYTCSEAGRLIAKKYKQSKDNDRLQCEMAMLVHLRNNNFSEAINLFVAYKKNDIFPSGAFSENSIPGMKKSLKVIFSANPGILKDVDKQMLEGIRVAAGMDFFWMKKNIPQYWLPDNFVWNHRLTISVACRMLIFTASRQIALKEIKDIDIPAGISITSAPDACEHCQTHKDKIYKLTEIPELPHPECTHEMGCRCFYSPVLKS